MWRAGRVGGTSASSCGRSRLRPCRRPCRVSLAELWPWEANLALAKAHARVGSAVTIAQQLNRQLGSSAYTPSLVGDQIERLRGSRQPTRRQRAMAIPSARSIEGCFLAWPCVHAAGALAFQPALTIRNPV
jgi:hypothetical protein